MTELRALLLDMDGTLVDTAEANFAAYAQALSEIGIVVDRDGFERVAAGRNWRQFLPGLVADTDVDPASVAARKQCIYETMAGRTRPIRAVIDLALAARASHRLGLVTSASRAGVAAVLGAHGLAAMFDTIVTGDDVAESKPSPMPYLLAAARLGVPPDRCLAVEDSDIGVESARRAGMAVLRVEP